MDLRNKIIKELAEAGVESQEVIEEVIADAFLNINLATNFYSTVEVSGLGTFVFSKKKGERELVKIRKFNELTENSAKKKYLEELVKYIEVRL